MKKLTILCLVMSCLVACKTTKPPKNVQEKQSTKKAASRWQVLKQAKGDLNRDGIDDFAVIFQSNNAALITKNDISPDGFLNLNPRRLVVYLGQSDGGFAASHTVDDFVLRKIKPNLLEPLETLEIDNGRINIEFSIMSTMGSWRASGYQYQFALSPKQKDLELTQFKQTDMHRGTGEASTLKIDFLANSFSRQTNDAEPKTSRLPKQRRITMSDLARSTLIELEGKRNEISLVAMYPIEKGKGM